MAPREFFRLLCALAVLHAVAPLLLLLLKNAANLGDWMFRVAVVLYWTWPVWLVALIPNRHESIRVFWTALALSLGGLALGYLPMAFLTGILLGGKT